MTKKNWKAAFVAAASSFLGKELVQQLEAKGVVDKLEEFGLLPKEIPGGARGLNVIVAALKELGVQRIPNENVRAFLDSVIEEGERRYRPVAEIFSRKEKLVSHRTGTATPKIVSDTGVAYLGKVCFHIDELTEILIQATLDKVEQMTQCVIPVYISNIIDLMEKAEMEASVKQKWRLVNQKVQQEPIPKMDRSEILFTSEEIAEIKVELLEVLDEWVSGDFVSVPVDSGLRIILEAMNQMGGAEIFAGLIPDDIIRWCEPTSVLRILYERFQVIDVKYVIDCDVDPYLSEGWEVEEHKKGGQFEWDPANVNLYLSDEQKDCDVIEGNKLRMELTELPCLNANVLDYLLIHPELISEEWKDKAVFFWGTIYYHSDGYLVVRYLRWTAGLWLDFYKRLDENWIYDHAAALARQ